MLTHGNEAWITIEKKKQNNKLWDDISKKNGKKYNEPHKKQYIQYKYEHKNSKSTDTRRTTQIVWSPLKDGPRKKDKEII